MEPPRDPSSFELPEKASSQVLTPTAAIPMDVNGAAQPTLISDTHAATLASAPAQSTHAPTEQIQRAGASAHVHANGKLTGG